MIRHRAVLLGAALFLTVVLLTPTGAYSTSATDRNVAISVVADENAYLSTEWECNADTMEVRITNGFSPSTVLDIQITVNGTSKTIDSLGAGASQTKTFETIDTVTVSATSSEASIYMTRPATVC